MLDAPKHLFNFLKNAKGALEDDFPHLFEVVREVIDRNCYYFLPENLLLSKLSVSSLRFVMFLQMNEFGVPKIVVNTFMQFSY